MGWLARLIWFGWFIWLIWFIWFNQTNQINHPVLTHPATHALFPPARFVDRDASRDTGG
jgi:hypothetical protein